MGEEGGEGRIEKDDTDFLKRIKEEILAFLFFLQHRTLSTKKESRMWFSPELIHTQALSRIIRSNRNRTEVEMAETCLEVMDCMKVSAFSFCINDMLLLLNCAGCRTDRTLVRRIVQDIWKLTPAENTLTYTTCQPSYDNMRPYTEVRRTGRFYTIGRKQLEEMQG